MTDIFINYGTDIIEMTEELLQEADIAARVSPSMRICIKPNLVVPHPANSGATTHPEIVEGIIRYLHTAGCMDIVIAEGAWVGDSTERAWKACGYEKLADKYGVKLLDTKKDRVTEQDFNPDPTKVVRASDSGHNNAGLTGVRHMSLEICESILQVDYLINVPVLKGHCQTFMTCCLKNMKGCIPDSEKRRYHTMGLHKPIAALNTVIRPDLHIIDNICGDPTFEEGGNPMDSDRILLGFDPVLLDSYCAGFLGYQPDEIDYLELAKEYGVGEYVCEHTKIAEYNREDRPGVKLRRGTVAQKMEKYIEQNGACSACYAALVSALNKTGGTPLKKIKIGQGFKGKSCAGAGVGNCASGCSRYVPGCPPKAVDIAEFLQDHPGKTAGYKNGGVSMSNRNTSTL